MLRISQGLLRALEESIDRGWFRSGELESVLGGREEAFYTLLEGFSLGLFRYRGEDEFEVRSEGLEILDAWREAGRPDTDPWIDSRVYSMLRAQSYSPSSPPGDWAEILSDRGLYVPGRGLSSAALKLLDLAQRLERSIVLTKSMARALLNSPEGPARREAYGRFQPVYEAMGLVVGTVPLAPYYSLTLPGRLLRRAVQRLNLDAPWPSVVNPWIVARLEKAERGEALEPEEAAVLGTIGYTKPTGGLSYAGRLVLEAVKAHRSARLRPPMALSPREETLLLVVRDLWREKEEKSPNLLVGKEEIAERLAERLGADSGRVPLDLLHLESLGLLEEAEEEGRTVYTLTREGEALAGAPGTGRGAPAVAIKALTYPYALLSPHTEWVEEASRHGIVGTGGPTRRGIILARLSGARRFPLLTRPEAAGLQRIPDEKSVTREEIAATIESEGGDPWESLERLETRGLVETLPDGRVILTRAGRLLKTALIGVPTGIATPVYPVLVRVLRAVEEYGTDDVARLAGKLRLPPGEVKAALTVARSAKYLGRKGGLTAAGRAILEALRELEGQAPAGGEL